MASDPQSVLARIAGMDVPIHWSEGSRYALIGGVPRAGHVVSQHATAAATYRAWLKRHREDVICPRDQAAYDDFVADYPDAVASGYDEGESEI